MERMYAWTELRDLGVELESLVRKQTIVAGESYPIAPTGMTSGLRDLLRHDGFDLDKSITVSLAPPPCIDAYTFRQGKIST